MQRQPGSREEGLAEWRLPSVDLKDTEWQELREARDTSPRCRAVPVGPQDLAHS